MKAPDAFRTISEVAEELDLPQHVLRFWETRFSQIRPMKRGGGRRYYRPEDVDLLRGIRILLYAEGFTIRGVQRLLKENGVPFVAGAGQTGSVQTAGAIAPDEHVAQGGRRLPGPPLRAGSDDNFAFPPERFESQGDPAVPERIAPKSPAAGPALVPNEVHRAGRGLALTPDSRRRLESLLIDLEEAKRLLDQVR